MGRILVAILILVLTGCDTKVGGNAGQFAGAQVGIGASLSDGAPFRSVAGTGR